MRVIGRLQDLRHRRRRADERRVADALVEWSLTGNLTWLLDGVHREEPFLQVSPAMAGTVLAWEVERLHAAGYVAIGPFWVPALWLRDGARYRGFVRLVADWLRTHAHAADDVFVPKAAAELEPLLALWPHVLVLPTSARLSIRQLLAARAWPVHPLGVAAAPAFADGAMRSPADFCFHDVDHARFKLREDLLARGIDVPDAYRDGSTFAPELGAHRTFVAATAPHLGAEGWRAAPLRARQLRGWLAAIERGANRPRGDAATWLLFELLHEKSLPVDAAVLSRALADDAHVDKLRRKCAAGFFAERGPDAAAVAELTAARWWLQRLLQREAA